MGMESLTGTEKLSCGNCRTRFFKKIGGGFAFEDGQVWARVGASVCIWPRHFRRPNPETQRPGLHLVVNGLINHNMLGLMPQPWRHTQIVSARSSGERRFP